MTETDNPDNQVQPDAFADAKAANDLRQQIAAAAQNAVMYSQVSRDWVNTWLVRLGAKPVTGSAQYQIYAPITGLYGKTVTADNRADALKQFNQYVTRVKASGKITDRWDFVYQVNFADTEPVFHSGPEDAPTIEAAQEMSLDELKANIRAMLMEAVSQHGWGYSYATCTLDAMGLERLPKLLTRQVSVPVTGTAQILVRVFEDASDEALQAAAQGAARASAVAVKAEEIGQASWTDKVQDEDALLEDMTGATDMMAALLQG